VEIRNEPWVDAGLGMFPETVDPVMETAPPLIRTPPWVVVDAEFTTFPVMDTEDRLTEAVPVNLIAPSPADPSPLEVNVVFEIEMDWVEALMAATSLEVKDEVFPAVAETDSVLPVGVKSMARCPALVNEEFETVRLPAPTSE